MWYVCLFEIFVSNFAFSWSLANLQMGELSCVVYGRVYIEWKCLHFNGKVCDKLPVGNVKTKNPNFYSSTFPAK